MIPFALRSGLAVSISDVSSGLGCNCICPACGQPLIARKGRRRTHHFAHYRTADCPHALESSLHLMAKSILKERQVIILPPVRVHGLTSPLYSARSWSYQRSLTEQHQENIIPDMMLIGRQQRIAVEIAVYHASEWNKIYRLQQLRLPAIEISLLPLYRQWLGSGKGANVHALADLIVNTTEHKSWLYHPHSQGLEYRLRQSCDRKRIRQTRWKDQIHYRVADCPAGKRYWRRGPMEGKAYAYVDRDCRHCRFCFEVEYERAHVGYRRIVTTPEYLYCMGNLPNDPAALRRWLLASTNRSSK